MSRASASRTAASKLRVAATLHPLWAGCSGCPASRPKRDGQGQQPRAGGCLGNATAVGTGGRYFTRTIGASDAAGLLGTGDRIRYRSPTMRSVLARKPPRAFDIFSAEDDGTRSPAGGTGLPRGFGGDTKRNLFLRRLALSFFGHGSFLTFFCHPVTFFHRFSTLVFRLAGSFIVLLLGGGELLRCLVSCFSAGLVVISFLSLSPECIMRIRMGSKGAV